MTTTWGSTHAAVDSVLTHVYYVECCLVLWYSFLL